MYFSTGRNTRSRCTQSLLNLSSNQHTDAKHNTDLLFANYCAHSHNGEEKILCLCGDWLAMRNEKCNPDTTTKARRVKFWNRWPGKFVKSPSLGDFESSPGKGYFWLSFHRSWGRSVQWAALQNPFHLLSVDPKVSCSLKHLRCVCTQDLPHTEVFQR